MQTLSEIKELLAQRGLAPRKALGQNFLVDHNLIRKLVDASGVVPGDAVLEIGPGTGALTEELLSRGCRVVAVELDEGLAELLRDRFATIREAPGDPPGASFTLIHGDALASKREINPEAVAPFAGSPFRLVANLPYGAGTPVMLALLTRQPACSGLFVTVQREVADRILAEPGTREFGTISVIAQALCSVSRIASLPRECFWPRPDVASSMIALTRLPTPLTDNPVRLADFCQSLFSKRRKQLGAVLGRSFPFPAGIDPDKRAEELSVTQIVALASVSN